MTDPERIKFLRTALASIERNLSGMILLIRAGSLSDVTASLKHIRKRCAEILKETE